MIKGKLVAIGCRFAKILRFVTDSGNMNMVCLNSTKFLFCFD